MTVTAKRVQPEPPPVRIVLEMDERDAGVLRHICQHIGGAFQGPRGAAVRIGEALDQAGVAQCGEVIAGTTGIYFTADW